MKDIYFYDIMRIIVKIKIIFLRGYESSDELNFREESIR